MQFFSIHCNFSIVSNPWDHQSKLFVVFLLLWHHWFYLPYMLYTIRNAERFVLTVLNKDYYYYYYCDCSSCCVGSVLGDERLLSQQMNQNVLISNVIMQTWSKPHPAVPFHSACGWLLTTSVNYQQGTLQRWHSRLLCVGVVSLFVHYAGQPRHVACPLWWSVCPLPVHHLIFPVMKYLASFRQNWPTHVINSRMYVTVSASYRWLCRSR